MADHDSQDDHQHEQRQIPSHFDSVEDELAFWKDHAELLQIQIDEVRLEIDEFRIRASELELELETNNDHLAEENVKLQERVEFLITEIEDIKSRAMRSEKNHNDNATSLQRAVDNLTRENESAKRAVVELEQGNDDLETQTRNVHSSFLDMESKHNRLLEEKIILEEDISLKDRLQEEVQRLKDEVRDQAEDITYFKAQIEALSARPLPSPLSLDSTPEKAPPIARGFSTDDGHLSIRPSSLISPVVEGNSCNISPVCPTFPGGVSSSGTPVSKRHSGIPLRALNSLHYNDCPSPPAKSAWGHQRTNTSETPMRQRYLAAERSPLGMATGRGANLNSSTSSMTRSTTLTHIAGVTQGGQPSPERRQYRQERPRRVDSMVSSRTITNMAPFTPGSSRFRVLSSATRPRGRIADQAEALANRASTAPGTSKAGQAMQAMKRQASNVQLRVASVVHKPRPAAIRHSSPGLDGGDLTTISTGSPGGWTHIARSNSPDKVKDTSCGRQGSRLKPCGDDDGDATLMPEESSRGSQKTLPPRPGIPSPYRTRSTTSAMSNEPSAGFHYSPPNGRNHANGSESSVGRSPEEPRAMTPTMESRLPVPVNRPSSRAGHYDNAPPRPSSRLAQSSNQRHAPSASRTAFPSSSATVAMPSRPSSRNEGRIPRPSTNGTRDMALQSSQSGLPRSARRISTGPGVTKGPSGMNGLIDNATPSRRSVSGRPASISHYGPGSIPPVPTVAQRYLTKASNNGDLSRDEMIGLGLEMPPRKR